MDWIKGSFEVVLRYVFNKNNLLCNVLKYGIVYGMSFPVLHVSIDGMLLPDSWKSSFVVVIGDGKCGLNSNSSMEVNGLYGFEVNIHRPFAEKKVSL